MFGWSLEEKLQAILDQKKVYLAERESILAHSPIDVDRWNFVFNQEDDQVSKWDALLRNSGGNASPRIIAEANMLSDRAEELDAEYRFRLNDEFAGVPRDVEGVDECEQLKRGVIYVFTNPSMPGLIKIGKTLDLKRRLADADKTFSASPFECVYSIEVDDYEKVEKVLHRIFKDCRERENREFFRMNPEGAIAALGLIKSMDNRRRDREAIIRTLQKTIDENS